MAGRQKREKEEEIDWGSYNPLQGYAFSDLKTFH
jgi:hypothetical protein